MTARGSLGRRHPTLILVVLAVVILALYALVFWWDNRRNDGEQTLIALDAPVEDRELTPQELAFFDVVESPVGAQPGDVIDVLPLATGIEDIDGTVFLYWSTDLAGALQPVSGVALWPRTAPPRPPPIVAFAHGTTGLADRCAPAGRSCRTGWSPATWRSMSSEPDRFWSRPTTRASG